MTKPSTNENMNTPRVKDVEGATPNGDNHHHKPVQSFKLSRSESHIKPHTVHHCKHVTRSNNDIRHPAQ